MTSNIHDERNVNHHRCGKSCDTYDVCMYVTCNRVFGNGTVEPLLKQTDRPTDRPTQGQAVASNFRWWYPRCIHTHTGTSYVRRQQKRGHPFSLLLPRAAYSFPLPSFLVAFLRLPFLFLALPLSLSLSLSFSDRLSFVLINVNTDKSKRTIKIVCMYIHTTAMTAGTRKNL